MSYSENFDSVVAPNVPAAWNVGAGVSTTSTLAGGLSTISPPNVLSMYGTVDRFATYGGGRDGGGGDVTGSVYLAFTVYGGHAKGGLTGRGSASTLDESSTSWYGVYADLNAGAVGIEKWLTGTRTAVATLATSALAIDTWYVLGRTLSGTSISLSLQRVSDGYWLNSSGVFQSGSATALTGSDSSIAGSGYSGLYGATSNTGGATYFDNWSETWVGANPVGPPIAAIRPVGLHVAARRGRVLVGPRVPQADRPTPLRPVRPVASPRRPHGGRVLIAVPGRTPDPPPALLRGLMVRPVQHPRRGSAWMPPPPPAASMQAQTPLVAAVRPVASPRRPHGGSAVIPAGARMPGVPPATPLHGLVVARPPGRRQRGNTGGRVWLPPQPRAKSDQNQTPLQAILRPVKVIATPMQRRRGRVIPAVPARIPQPIYPPLVRGITAAVRRTGDDRARRRKGLAWIGIAEGWPFPGFRIRPPFDGGVWYDVYSNTFGAGDPINYDGNPLVQTTLTTWTTPPLAPGLNKLAVRAENLNGVELNRDCAAFITLDAAGNDISNLPLPPSGLRAFPIGAGAIRCEWWARPTPGPRLPTGFNVYAGIGTPSYATPAQVVPYSSGLFGTFKADINSLTPGAAYAIGVRAFNGVGEENNAAYVAATAGGSGPAAVQSLTVKTIT